MDPGFRTRYQLVGWSDAPACRAPICHFGVSDRSHSRIGRSERHDVACAVTLTAAARAAVSATTMVAARAVSVASNTVMRCGYATPSFSTRA